MYRVTKRFSDRLDGGRVYNPGDAYPRSGYTPPDGRAEALCAARKTAMNRMGQVFLAEEAEKPKPAKKRR